ncbi:MAG: hypothetical protein DME26_07520 [Verrucomicrobia bacterium]|nr:MAG: hypothetical protein DME26_07520 [Verrucomicrobiota bacterium]
MEKKVARVLKKIRHVRGLSVDEKYLFARSLAATPDERWQLHQNFLRSLGLSTRSMQKRFGLLSSE